MASLADFPADDFESAPLFFVEPRDKMPSTEAERQRTLLSLLARFAPNVMVFSVPNEGRLSNWQRLDRWRNGALRGAPDLLLFWNHGCAAIEMKGGSTPLRRSQIEALNRLHRLGHRVGVFRKPETAFHMLREWGAPVAEMVI